MTAKVMKKAPNAQRRVCLFILGMHRSGTSALAKVLGILGADLPRNLMGVDHGNELGHWESSILSAFDDEILGSGGSSWDDWLPFNPDWYKSLIYDRFVQRGGALLNDEFGDSPLFVFKDPRNCRIAPFWLDVLKREGIEPGIIIPLRHFHEVADSLNKRDATKLDYGALLWLRHVLDAEAATRGRRRVFATYHRLLADWHGVVTSIEADLELTFPRKSAKVSSEIAAFLDRSHRHFTVNESLTGYDTGIGAWLEQVYRLLAKWSEQGEDPADYPLIDTLAEEFEKGSVAFAPIIAQNSMSGAAGEGERRRLELEGQVGQLERELAEASAKAAEIGQLQESLAHNQQILRQRDEDWERAQAERVDLERQLSEAVARQDEMDAQRAALLHTENVLRQREEEIEQTRAELANAKAALQDAQIGLSAKDTELGELTQRLSEQEAESVAVREAMVAAQSHSEALLASLAGARDQALQALAASEQQADQLRAHASWVETRLRAAEEETASLRAAREETQRLVENQNHNLGTLNLSLRRQTEEANGLASQAEWLREINAILHAEPSWWALLPASSRRARRHQRLLNRDLFDAEAYLRLHPDVAANGVDPLIHYILHGMEEGRDLGI